MSRKKLTAKPVPTQGPLSGFSDLLIRHSSPEDLKALREILLRCPEPGAAKAAEKLQAGIRSKVCGTRADRDC